MSSKTDTETSSFRTLLTSVVLSTPGPLVIGLGLLIGHSSTQMADFFRRSAELLAIICAFVIYQLTHTQGTCDEARKARLECAANRFVGAMMCVAGVIMMWLAIFQGQTDKGNVIPGLAIGVLGMVANCIFWRRYSTLNRKQPNAIIAVQARLYRAKTFVDTCVSLCLGMVLMFPASQLGVVCDLCGSLIVSAYMIYCGFDTFKNAGQTSRL